MINLPLARCAALAMLFLLACTGEHANRLGQEFDSQGHRGARGLAPENTLPAFEQALRHGMRTLELDLAVTADNQLIVSHEPWFNPLICALDSTDYHERTPLYTLTYDEIALVDCGSRGHPGFPDQKLERSSKPLLRRVVQFADSIAQATQQTLPRYNLEIKYEEDFEGVFAPPVERFAARLDFLIKDLGIADRVAVQSFHLPALEAMHALSPELPSALLVAVPLDPLRDISRLSFRPTYYSPNHVALRPGVISALHKAGVQVIPWTVNDADRMATLIAWGVDGLITDYPDRLAQVLAASP